MTDASPVRLEDTAAIVLGSMLRDPARAAALADDVEAWIAANAEVVGENLLPWRAAKATEVGLAALAEGNLAALDDPWIERLTAAPVAGRVAIVLHRFLGMDLAETAARCLRSEQQIGRLVGSVADLDDPPAPVWTAAVAEVEPVPEAAVAQPIEPIEPVADLVAPTVPSPAGPVAGPVVLPPAAPVTVSGPPDPLPVGPVRRRRWPTVVAALVVAALAIGSAVALSDRPSKAERPRTTAEVGPATQAVARGESKGCTGPDAGLVSDGELITQQVGGLERSYRLYAPATATPGVPRGLVVAFADVSEPVPVFVAETGLDAMARDLGLVVVHLMPVSAPTAWNVLGSPDEPSDIGTAALVVQQLLDRVCIDEERVVLTGKGVGGHLALAVACARPTAITAVVVVGGAFRPDTCAPFTGTAVILTVGGTDDVFPPSGGTGPGYQLLVPDPAALPVGGRYDPPPFDATISAWSTDLGCITSTSEARGDSTVSRYGDCYDDNRVVAAVTPAAGHQWTEVASELLREELAPH